ncbi:MULTISPECIES: hypothetical protein [unclassified Streptomyces]|uniref:hypothetical protein n=1 Tax=unclassified Streptomyces TaxID=2593676 RepID=UPI002250D238|nr:MULTISPECIES: hypothetical protein [unclassified Streptomyces]MCX5050599.1 hypothetical protein [Streptomyces sp. NBC_00474]
MGDRHSDGTAPGRRHVHPGGTLPTSGEAPVGPALESLLADALRSGVLDADAEQRAVAAFRAARDGGAHRARTRRRDDWRPREHGRARRSLRATLTLSLAGLTLGGVAYAAIGTVGGSSGDGHAARQQAHAPVVPSTTVPRAPVAPSTPDRPDTAKDTEAHCRAYEKVKGHGKAMESTAWQRLIAAAGGERNVTAYCTEQLGRAKAENTPAKATKPKKPEKAKKPEEPTKPTKLKKPEEPKKAEKVG